MEYDLDQGAGTGLRAGLVVLSTDETMEYEVRQVLAGRGVNLMHTRIPFRTDVTPSVLQEMAEALPQAAALLPQGLHSIAYGCTSGATVIGPKRIEEIIQKLHPNVPVTDPMTAVITALKTLNTTRIALVTPYVASVTGPMRVYLAQHGIEVVSEVSFAESDDRKVARITEASTRAAMLKAGRAKGVEAVFASCTNLRSFGVIEEVEARLGLPVISSNQALIWHMLQLAGAAPKGWGPGRLYDLKLPG